MADPIIKRIDEHPNLVGVAAIDDKVLGIDASQLDPAQKTVLIAMDQLSIHSPSQLAANTVDSSQIKEGAINLAHLATETLNEVEKNLVYIQLYQPEDAIITKSAISYFFVPSYLAGKRVVQVGMGIVTTSAGKTVTVQLGTSGAYGSVSAVTTTESTVSKTLPAALTKIPINVTCTTGTPAPKGLDFWFLVI